MIYCKWCKLGIQVTQIIFLSATIAGCGYTTRSMISDKYRTIYVTPFENKIDVTQEAYSANRYRIYRPTLETDITRSVNNKFLTDGNLKPIKEESADLILKGELVEFRRDPLRYTESDEVEEYRINIVVNLVLYDRKENAQVWQENNFTGDTTYFTTGSLAKSEDTATNDALSDLARRIVERTVEQW
ncbi:MAG: hypothetical protein AMJ95_02085 [Omnitrophica WOR_2 bacterium SM23_72]|nr:MAG: hypothetical protein AMJ95_02085 [Omnitrophica WOR_2 bacterium SM23_72]